MERMKRRVVAVAGAAALALAAAGAWAQDISQIPTS